MISHLCDVLQVRRHSHRKFREPHALPCIFSFFKKIKRTNERKPTAYEARGKAAKGSSERARWLGLALPYRDRWNAQRSSEALHRDRKDVLNPSPLCKGSSQERKEGGKRGKGERKEEDGEWTREKGAKVHTQAGADGHVSVSGTRHVSASGTRVSLAVRLSKPSLTSALFVRAISDLFCVILPVQWICTSPPLGLMRPIFPLHPLCPSCSTDA